LLDKRLGRVIADRRRKAALSQERLAAKAHLTYISQIERGLKSPTVRALAGVAKALGALTSDLIRAAESGDGPE
jgi:transcriptional regulator with XRE-family HTH domain